MNNFENFDPPELSPGGMRNQEIQVLGAEADNSSPVSCSENPTSVALVVYLVPVFGFFPSLWTLYRRQGSREQLTASRLSVTLGLSWVLGYFLLASGAATSEFLTLRLLILNSFLTSGYFLVSVWLMVHTARGRTKRLPGLSNFADRLLGKYL